MNFAESKAIGAMLRAARHIAVISHMGTDGDAISSLAAAGVALEQLGLRATLFSDDLVPTCFLNLPLASEIKNGPVEGESYDLVLSLDSGDLGRLGNSYRRLADPKPPIINIDHHQTNTLFGVINLVRPDLNSNTEILYHLFLSLGANLVAELAACLLTGLVTDTLGFRTSRVNGETMRTASALIDAGADLYAVTSRAMNIKPFSTLLFWQKGLEKMTFEDGLIWVAFSNQEQLETGHSGPGVAGLGSFLSNAEPAIMSVVITETPDGNTIAGFRCRPPYSVAELAESLGGGGHPAASGCTVTGPFESATQTILEAARRSASQQVELLGYPETSL